MFLFPGNATMLRCLKMTSAARETSAGCTPLQGADPRVSCPVAVGVSLGHAAHSGPWLRCRWARAALAVRPAPRGAHGTRLRPAGPHDGLCAQALPDLCAQAPRTRARTCLAATDGCPPLPADNVAWEDPRIDQHLLRMGADDTLLVLTTGGCNVLDPPCFISQGESVAREIAHA